MALTTPRFALPYPVAADPNNVPADLLALATRLDNIVMTFGQGTLASRPAAGVAGRVWFATDTKDVSFDTGSVWRSLTGLPVIPMARYYLDTAAVAAPLGTSIPFNKTSFNRNGFSLITTPMTAIGVPVTGYYRVRGCARHNFGASTANVGIQQSILKNGGATIAFKQEAGVYEATVENDITCEIETRVQLNGGDTVTFKSGASPGSTYYNTADTTFCELELLSVN